MNKNTRLNGFKVPIVKSNNKNEHKPTPMTCEKWTNTTKELNECKKCLERSKNNLSYFNDDELKCNYAKAINYINNCHHFINEITKKIAESNNNSSTNSTINMPDLPNFLALYTSLLYAKETNINVAKELIDVESPKSQFNNDDILKNFHDLIPHQYRTVEESAEQYIEEFENKEAGDCVEEIYAREAENLPPKDLKEERNLEPITSVMDEVCNLADITSQRSIKVNQRQKKSLTFEQDVDNKTLKNNERWQDYENDEDDLSNTAPKAYTIYSNNNNETTNCNQNTEEIFDYKQEGVHFCNTNNNNGNQNTFRTKIPLLHKKANNQDDENFLPAHYHHFRTRSPNNQMHNERVKKADNRHECDNARSDSPKRVYCRNPQKTYGTSNRRSSPSPIIHRDPNWNSSKESAKNQFHKSVPVLFGQHGKINTVNPADFATNNRADYNERNLSSFYDNNQGILKNVNKTTAKSHHCLIEDNENNSNRNVVNQQLNSQLKRQSVTSKRSVSKTGHTSNDAAVVNHNTSKINKQSSQEHDEQNNMNKRCFIQSNVTVCRVESRTNDFFTEHHRTQSRTSANLKQNFSNPKIDNDLYYSDSDIDEDHFEENYE